MRLSQRILEQFQAARRLRDMFFAKGSQTPALAFFGDAREPRRLRQPVRPPDRRSKHAKRRPVPRNYGTSSGLARVGAAVATFEERFLDPPTLSFAGPWAWFRMIDATVQTRRIRSSARCFAIGERVSSGSSHRRAVERRSTIRSRRRTGDSSAADPRSESDADADDADYAGTSGDATDASMIPWK